MMLSKIISVLGVIILLEYSAFAGSREYCQIAGKKVAVADIELNVDFKIKENPSVAQISYTFYLDERDLNIALSYVDRYLKGRSGYKVMGAIILLYVQDEFKKYPCVGNNKCVKNIEVSVRGFFEFLNANQDLKKRYLEAAISQSLFSAKYSSMSEFLFYRARDVGYALFGISYMKADSMMGWTLIDKMIYSIRNDGYNGIH